MAITRFRALPVKEDEALGVDREQRIIFGVSTAQAVEALGHGVALDDKSIKQIVELGNSKKNGVKCRFTHPGMSSDGMGKYLGRLKDFRQEGDKALADLYLSPLASKSPNGDLGAYVMDMAEEESDMFGMSVVIDMQKAFIVDGEEWENEPSEYEGLPVARVKNLVACDVVDEPAANRDGMFSSALWASNKDAEKAFNELDEVLSEWGVSPAKAYEVAIKYFNARGVDIVPKGEEMADKKTDATEEVLSAQLAEMQKALAEQKEQAEAMKEALAAKEAAEAEALGRASELESALDASNERIAKMETEARRARFAEMAKEWTGETENHVMLLETLADTSGEDSDAFKFYVQTQNANAEQLDTSALLEELGSNKEPEAPVSFDQAVRSEMKASGVDYDTAARKVAKEQPELYKNRG